MHDADARWPDLQAVADLNICTYVIEPVRDDRGQLLGTLCAVSARRVPVSGDTRLAMRLVASMLARQMQVEHMATMAPGMAQEVSPGDVNIEVFSGTGIDALTGLPDRRGLEAALGRRTAGAPDGPGWVCLALVDVLGFEAFDARHGHQAANRLLAALAHRLQAVRRENEYFARYGDREFAVMLPLSEVFAQNIQAGTELGQRLLATTQRGLCDSQLPIDAPRVAVEIIFSRARESVPSLLHRADATLQKMRRPAIHDAVAHVGESFGDARQAGRRGRQE